MRLPRQRAHPVQRGELPLKSPVAGAEYDSRGPARSHLMDLSSIENKVTYPDLRARHDEWQVVTESDAQPFLPEQAEPIKVDFDSSAIKETMELPILTSASIDKHVSDKKRGHVIHAGGAIWGLDFAPKRPSVDTKPCTQYLAIGGFRSTSEHHDVEEVQPAGQYKNCIQIWRCNLSVKASQEAPLLDMCLVHDYGVVHELKWCPFGAYEETLDPALASGHWPKLGVLCGVFGDGLVHAMVVPHPEAIRSQLDIPAMKPIYLRVQRPRCSFALSRTRAKALSWGGYQRLAAGYTNGSVVIWDIERALARDDAYKPELSYRFMCANILAHDSAVRAIAWHGLSDPVNFMTAGHDGRTCVFDVRDPSVCMTVCRVRGFIQGIAWPGHGDQLFYVDSDNIMRGYRTADCTEHKITSKYAENRGFVWSLAASEQHFFIAGVTSDGWVKINSVLSKSRRIRTPAKQPIVYKLMYNVTAQTFRYVDNLAPMTLERHKELVPEFCSFIEPDVAIHRAAWNPNRATSAWIATGGTAGLCRLDFIGFGEDWD